MQLREQAENKKFEELLARPIPQEYIDLDINHQHNVEHFLKLKDKLITLCSNFVDFGNYFSERVELD